MTTTVRPVSEFSVPAPPTSQSWRAGTTTTSTVTSPKRLARIAGILYLLVGITGGFAEGFVEPKMYAAGDAAGTAAASSRAAGLYEQKGMLTAAERMRESLSGEPAS